MDKRPANAAGLICKDEERANPKLVGAWNRRYLFLPVALIPLLILLLSPANQNDISQRFSQTVSKLSEQDQARINESISKQETTLEDVVMALPGHRIEDAHLSRDSWRHWLYAAMAAGVFFLFLILVFYASNYYNGIQTAEIYAVRFISCVALHAIWSGAAAIMLFDRQHLVKGRIEGAAGILEFLLYLLTIVAVPMVLHGFYDTLLKKEMNGLAFFVAAASFGWMAFQVERLRRVELQPQRLPTVAGVSIGR